MKHIFMTRPNYRICLGFNPDYVIMKDDLKSRIGNDDTDNHIESKYITIVKSEVVKEKYKMDLLKKRLMLTYII